MVHIELLANMSTMTFSTFIMYKGNLMTKYIMTTESADQIGIVAALSTCLSQHDGFIIELAQFGTHDSERFYSRIEFIMAPSILSHFQKNIDVVAEQLNLSITIIHKSQKTKTLIMVSKFDHCLADLLYRRSNGSLNIDVTAIASNHEVTRHHAEKAGLPFHFIPITKDTKAEAENNLRELVTRTGTELIVLARYMQILTDSICKEYSGQIINIHHSFLPSFKGAKPYHRAYDLGVKLIGATAHYVNADLDEGPIIEQTVKRVDHTMQPEKLIALGRDVEAQTLARAVELHTEHRSFINGRKTVILP